MRQEAARLTNLVQDLITLSRIQARRADPRPGPVDVDAVVAEALDRCRMEADRPRHRAAVRGQRGLTVLGDEDLLVTALRNLVDNAVAYSPEQTRVVVSAVRIRTADIEISVADQGIGIPERDLERIFERFYRVDPARSRATGGTGLGLAIVKHVDGHPRRRGSSRGATRAPDRPSRCGCRASPLRADGPARPPAQGGSQVTRVLVVEDEESFSDALSYMLRKEGFEVAVCPTGPARWIPSTAPAPIWCCSTSCCPGCPAARSAGRCAQRSNVPVIMLTAKDSEIDKVVGLELGADDYVTKPFSSRELVARMRAVLRRRGEGGGGRRDVMEVGPVRMDIERHIVIVRGAPVQLPLKEFELLEVLLRNAGRVLTRMQLIDRVWGSDYVGDTKTLDVHIKRLRAKIEPDPAGRGTSSRSAASATSSNRPPEQAETSSRSAVKRDFCRTGRGVRVPARYGVVDALGAGVADAVPDTAGVAVALALAAALAEADGEGEGAGGEKVAYS